MAERFQKMQCSGCKKFFTPPILACAKCRTRYCSADCQRVDWPHHKSHCKVLQKSAARQAAVLAQTGTSLMNENLAEPAGAGAVEALTAEFRVWSDVMGGNVTDLYRTFFQISTKRGQERSKRETLYILVNPSATATSFRHKFSCIKCDIDRTSDPFVNALFDERERNPDPTGALMGSVIFELNLRAVMPDLPRNHGVRKITTQIPISVEVAANTPVVPNYQAWAMFEQLNEEAWDAYDAAEGNA